MESWQNAPNLAPFLLSQMTVHDILLAVLLLAVTRSDDIKDCQNASWDFNNSSKFVLDGTFAANSTCVMKLNVPLSCYITVELSRPEDCLSQVTIRNSVGDKFTAPVNFNTTFPPAEGTITITMGSDPERISLKAEKVSMISLKNVSYSTASGKQGLLFGFVSAILATSLTTDCIYQFDSKTSQPTISVMKYIDNKADPYLMNVFVYDKPVSTAPPVATLFTIYSDSPYISSSKELYLVVGNVHLYQYYSYNQYILVNDHSNIKHMSKYDVFQFSGYASSPPTALLTSNDGLVGCSFIKAPRSQGYIVNNMLFNDTTSYLTIYSGTPTSNSSNYLLWKYNSADTQNRLPQLFNQPIFTAELDRGTLNFSIYSATENIALLTSNLMADTNSWKGFVTTENYPFNGTQILKSTTVSGNFETSYYSEPEVQFNVEFKVQAPPNAGIVFANISYYEDITSSMTTKQFNITKADSAKSLKITCFNFTVSMSSSPCNSPNVSDFPSSGVYLDLEIDVVKSTQQFSVTIAMAAVVSISFI